MQKSKNALENNHADKLIKIKCSESMVNYTKEVSINNALYEITFPGCPIIDKPIQVKFIAGFDDFNNVFELTHRFFPQRN